MIPRGSPLRALVALAALAGALSPIVRVGATTTIPSSDNAETLTISLPGPFNGCSALDAGATPTSDAVLDLIRPSAFQTTDAGNLVGEGAPIVTAELTSLSPETVVYTVAPDQLWSNRLIFSGADLLAWWNRARRLQGVLSDGYRAISSLTESATGLTVTAVFATPYADWDLLFRDVEARGSAPGCAISNLVTRPSLGSYRAVSATTSRIVLEMNPEWTIDPGRFGRLVLVTSDALPATRGAFFAGYSLAVTRAQLEALSAHPAVLSHIGTSSDIEEMTFAPSRPLTLPLRLREALSWSLDRQTIIDHLWDSVTFSPSVAASALFSQGQVDYPGTVGTGPTDQTTTTALASTGSPSGLADCSACAVQVLRLAGYQHVASGWATDSDVPLRVRVAVGPSSVDQQTAAAVVAQWQAAGIGATVANVASDVDASVAAAHDLVDVAIFSRPTTTTPSYTARSWYGPGYADSYPSGNRSTIASQLYLQAIANFNPVAARATWLALDGVVLNNYWVRPFFTAPSLVEWSSTLNGVYGSISVPGFLDQVLTWSSTAS